MEVGGGLQPWQETARDKLGSLRVGSCEFLFKQNSLVAVDQDPVFQMVSEAAGQNRVLHIFSQPHHVFDRVTVTDSDHVRLYDGSRVQVLGNIMAGRSD